MTEHPGDTPHEARGTLPRGAMASAWILYGLIVLEILFMVSPLAAYYYAVYAAPLNALAGSPRTAWLTQQVLPHFTHSASPLVNGLLLVAWPLILGGLVLFLWGCARVYHAKLTGRGPVVDGLYRYVRHPQYLALAIVGLGTTLYWSRFLVLIAYVAMLWLYGSLARAEERRCLARFGATYADYLARTGRFLPRPIESLGARKVRLRLPDWLCRSHPVLAAARLLLLLALVLSGGFALRHHALESLTVERAGPHAVVFLAALAESDRNAVAALVRESTDVDPRLAYVAPAHWSVPELGLEGTPDAVLPVGRELAHPGSHGNRGGFARRRITVLIANPGPVGATAGGLALLAAATRIAPELRLTLDLETDRVTAREAARPGRWDRIPVPAF